MRIKYLLLSIIPCYYLYRTICKSQASYKACSNLTIQTIQPPSITQTNLQFSDY